MNQKKNKAKKLRRMQRIYEREEQDLDSAMRHSRSYHRFFEGYSEEYAERANGKGKRIHRTYVGTYYTRCCTDVVWITTKLSYLLLYLVAVVMYILSASLPVVSNAMWCTALPGLLSVPALILLGAKLAACMVTKRVLIAYELKQVFGRLPIYCFVASGLLLATGAGALLSIAWTTKEYSFNTMVPVLGSSLAAGLLLVVGFVEHRARYESMRNPVPASETGVIIQLEL